MLDGSSAGRVVAHGYDAAAVEAAVRLLTGCFRAGGKLLAFGNGGSAADAQHIAAELVGRLRLKRAPLPAIALTTDTSALTAIANDFGFEHVYARQLQALGRPGDVALAISVSGTSANVVAALRAARAQGVATIALTGAGGGEAAQLADIWLSPHEGDTQATQEAHLVCEHVLCGAVEEALFGGGAQPPEGRSAPGVVSLDELLALRERWRTEGLSVVWTNGCFDLLHVGHVRSFDAARALGDRLIVGVNSDRTVTELKGVERPLVPAAERAQLIAALRAVDAVTIFDDTTPTATLDAVRPDVHTKGADYAERPIPERAVVESYGGRVELLPLVHGVSTTLLLERGRKTAGGA